MAPSDITKLEHTDIQGVLHSWVACVKLDLQELGQ